MRRPEALNIIKKILCQVAPDAEVILYGSEARGDARPDSDFDLLILTPEKLSPTERRKVLFPLFDLSLEHGIEVNPIVYSQQDWASRPFLTPFYCNVVNEGIRL